VWSMMSRTFTNTRANTIKSPILGTGNQVYSSVTTLLVPGILKVTVSLKNQATIDLASPKKCGSKVEYIISPQENVYHPKRLGERGVWKFPKIWL
jgi:hypothetical protein